jgi:hypothetical protein
MAPLFKQVSNEQGLTCDIISSHNQEYEVIMGGDDTNPSWDDYLELWVDEFRQYLLLIKKSIEENGLVGETGESFANKYTFKFSDGKSFGFTWRAWGDLMQSIVNKNEGYMAYYM